MSKTIKLLVIFSFLYEDLKNFLEDIIRGKPKRDGIFLLGPNTNIRFKLLDHLNNYGPIFDILGDEKNYIPCTTISMLSNNIFIYSNNRDVEIKLCSEIHDNIYATILNSIKIPFYIKWLGYNAVHFELFGQYHNASENVLSSYIKILNTGSTIILATTTHNISLMSWNEELIFKTFTNYTNNPYIRFINFILINPGKNIFVIKTARDSYAFTANAEQILEPDDFNILKWQQEQIKSFIDFFYRNIIKLNGPKEEQFKEFIIRLQNLYKQELIAINETQVFDLKRYKELLLFNYIIQDKIDYVQTLIKNGVDINSKLLSGATYLYLSAYLGNLKLTTLLISLDATIDAMTDNNATPLIVASLNNFPEITELLINSKANLNAIDKNGNNALILAAEKRLHNITEIIISYNPNLNHKNDLGDTALSIASSLNDIKITAQLLDAGADTNLGGRNNINPIISAINQESHEIVKLFLSYGINPSIIDGLLLECSELLKNEIIKYQSNPISFILTHNSETIKTVKALENIISVSYLEEDTIKYINQIKNCILELSPNQCYDNLIGLCSEADVFETLFMWPDR